MNWWIISAIILMVISVVCAITNVVELFKGTINLKHNSFAGGTAFHIITAIIGILLLLKGIQGI